MPWGVDRSRHVERTAHPTISQEATSAIDGASELVLVSRIHQVVSKASAVVARPPRPNKLAAILRQELASKVQDAGGG